MKAQSEVIQLGQNILVIIGPVTGFIDAQRVARRLLA